MTETTRIKIAVQKSGRLNNDSIDLLIKCGLSIRLQPQALFCHVENFPIDILFIRDDDIPTLVMDQVCDLGIVGENILLEKNSCQQKKLQTIRKLGFCRCRLSIALPVAKTFHTTNDLNGLKIATSYPNLLQTFLAENNIAAEIMKISGSVEIAPKLGMADAICDLVSTGRTLKENNLKEVEPIIQSEAVLIQAKRKSSPAIDELLMLLLSRIDSVLKAHESKYIMFHVPTAALSAIKTLLPGCETPTILLLQGVQDKVAVHVVSHEKIFWTTLEKLKEIGATSILVLPIEKMLN